MPRKSGRRRSGKRAAKSALTVAKAEAPAEPWWSTADWMKLEDDNNELKDKPFEPENAGDVLMAILKQSRSKQAYQKALPMLPFLRLGAMHLFRKHTKPLTVDEAVMTLVTAVQQKWDIGAASNLAQHIMARSTHPDWAQHWAPMIMMVLCYNRHYRFFDVVVAAGLAVRKAEKYKLVPKSAKFDNDFAVRIVPEIYGEMDALRDALSDYASV